MRSIPHDELEVGMVVLITKANSTAPGLVDALFTIMAIDRPYIVLRSGGAYGWNHMIKMDDEEYALPEPDFVAAMVPSKTLDAEFIEDRP